MDTKLPLSPEALAILRNAKAKGGKVLILRADGAGKGIVLDAENKFPDDAEAKRRNWDALQDLVGAGLLDKLSESRYELTSEGYAAAKEL